MVPYFFHFLIFAAPVLHVGARHGEREPVIETQEQAYWQQLEPGFSQPSRRCHGYDGVVCGWRDIHGIRLATSLVCRGAQVGLYRFHVA
jgi:hypothetical protein